MQRSSNINSTIKTYGEISIHPEMTDKDLLLLTDCKVWMHGLLIALLELGVTSLRVPLADLANADVRRRLSDFVRLGFGFTVYSFQIAIN